MRSLPARVLGTLVLMIMIATLLGACAERPWFVYKAPDGSFVASFPFEPTKSIKTMITADGSTDVTFYNATDNQMVYTVAVSEYAADHIQEVGPAKFLDTARDGAVANTHGKLQSETPVDVKGNPGRDIKIAATGGKGMFRCKLILVGNRLYQIIVASPDADSSDVKRFLNSFSLK
jgi:hypothetical protein